MDWNTISGILRAVIPAILAYVVAKGYLSQSAVADVTSAIVTLAAAVWSVSTNLPAKK